tara:strand:+ start:560 stop:1063 length:504 start_codon:yes stop_codon:yes gene_type:complete
MFTCYKRGGKYINTPIEVGFRFQKKLIFDKDTFDPEIWVERLERIKSQDFNRIKIPEFTYEIIDNEILFEIEFIKGRQLGATTFVNWKDVIKEDLVDGEDHWGFSDLKPENFVIEKNTDTLYLVDFDTYNPRDRKSKLLEWNKYLKKSVDEIVENERIDLKNKFWSS